MNDHLLRATDAENQIRVFAGVTTELIEEARERHETSPLATAALGRTMTAAALMGMTLKESQQVSVQIRANGPLGGVYATADVEGNVRGYVKNPQAHLNLNNEGKLDVSKGLGAGMLNIIKDMGLKEPYRGSVPLVSGEIGEDLTYYFTKSEQTPSAVGLGVLVGTDELDVKAAGGFILQLMPDTPDDVIEKLEANIGNLPKGITPLIENGEGAEQILDILLDGFAYRITERRGVEFKCICSRDKIEGVVLNLGKEEAYDILEEEGHVEITCQFCNKSYKFIEKELDMLFND